MSLHSRAKKRLKRKKHRAAPGAPPGTLVAREDSTSTVVRQTIYNAQEISDEVVVKPLEMTKLTVAGSQCWIDVEGFGDLDVIRHLGQLAELHSLSVEDIVTYQRPKVDLHQKTALLTLQTLLPSGGYEQLTVVVGEGFLLTFQEGLPGDCFEPLRQRLLQDAGLVRKRATDYLAYAVLDAVIDSYFPVVEKNGEFLEKLEDEVLALLRPGSELVDNIREARRELSSLHRNLRPLLDCLSAILRDSHTFSDETRLYLNDCRDHVLQLLDSLDGQREIVAQLTDLYLSGLSNRMNQTMSVLTVIATIFMPLSFIAGVYGMNFSQDASPYNMPELYWRYGYLYALALMGLSAAGMLYFFRRRGWFKTD